MSIGAHKNRQGRRVVQRCGAALCDVVCMGRAEHIRRSQLAIVSQRTEIRRAMHDCRQAICRLGIDAEPRK